MLFVVWCAVVVSRRAPTKRYTNSPAAASPASWSSRGGGPVLQLRATLINGGETPSPKKSMHHLEKLKNENLVKVRREGTYLWYSANADALQELLGFLYAECCTRNKAVERLGELVSHRRCSAGASTFHQRKNESWCNG